MTGQNVRKLISWWISLDDFHDQYFKAWQQTESYFGYVSNLKECFLDFAFVTLPYVDPVAVPGRDTGRHARTSAPTQVSFCDISSVTLMDCTVRLQINCLQLPVK